MSAQVGGWDTGGEARGGWDPQEEFTEGGAGVLLKFTEVTERIGFGEVECKGPQTAYY